MLIEEGEACAVPDHHVLADADVEEVVGGDGVRQNLKEQEVRLRRVDLNGRPGAHFADDAGPFAGNELLRLFDVVLVLEHDLPGLGGQRIDRPRILAGEHVGADILISRDGIAETEARRGEEFRGAAENGEVVVRCAERDRGDARVIVRKFRVGLVDHDEDAVRHACVEDPPHVLPRDVRRGRVVRIADDEEVHAVIEEGAEFLHIEPEVPVLAQRVVGAAAPGDADLALVL